MGYAGPARWLIRTSRTRLGRLIGAMAPPALHLGVGIGENAAMIVAAGERIEAAGSGSA